ncbi:MAG: PAS domain S-box protein, partial [Terriglobales bacterium]
MEAILPAILEVAQSLIAADGYAVWRVDDSGTWRIIASAGLSDAYRNSVIARANVSDGYLPRTTLSIPNVLEAELLKERAEFYAAEKIESLLIAPLFTKSEITGTLAFYFRSRHESTEDEMHLATALANLTSSAFAFSALLLEQERSRQQSEFLAEASAVLASSMDYEVTLATVTQLAVPQIADWCAIDLYENGVLQRVGVAHADPAKLNLTHEYRRLYPPNLESAAGLGSVLRTGKPQFWPHVSEEMLKANAYDEQHLALLRALGLQSFLIMPLQVRDRILGALTLVTANRDLDDTDFKLAEDLARRAAIAIENSSLFTALEQSERKFRTMADTVPCAIYIHDGTRLVYVNQAAQDLSGYTAAELEKLPLYDLVHPDHRELVRERAAARLRGDNVASRYELKGLRKDGTIRWLDFAGALIDFAGSPALLATAFDITERKLAQEQIERSEKEARTLVENLPDVIARYSRDLRYVYMSPNVERITGISAEHFIGKRHCESGLPPDLCEMFDNSLRRIFATGEADHIEFVSTGSDGERKHIAGLGVPLFDASGAVEQVLTISHDLTPYRKAEEAVARNEKELRLLTDILPALVAYVDADERFQRVNQTFEQWFDRPKSQLVGRTLREILGPNYSHVDSHVKRALRGETVQYEATNDYADTRRHVLITYVPDFDAERRVR